MRRLLRKLLVAVPLLLLGPAALTAWGQGTPNPNQAGNGPAAPGATQEESGGGGDPLYGYIGFGFLMAGAIFVICKSARR